MTGQWISCRERLPEVGEDIILFFRDRFHKDPSWPKTAVCAAWRCNLSNNTPKGAWAIEGRFYHHFVVPFEDGIAWMPLPEAPDLEEISTK